ncbi:MAG: protein of unknown function containing DUF4159 domain [Bacteroidetes bacterium HLUCCA01]|nr:MAG: protein of unknown function containing DUF4159 domain [Bacteroidetes bacterium HLUCCA01]
MNSVKFQAIISLILLWFSGSIAIAQTSADDAVRIARAEYRGGGDWYNDASSLTNLIRYVNANLPAGISQTYDDVALGSRDIFNYPFLFLTGHGNITLNRAEQSNLRKYLDSGGFLYIDDDYGLDPFIRPLLQDLFPDAELVNLPFTHPIYHQAYKFDQGLPKVHEHDGKPPQGLGLFRNGRLVVFYTYESNLADGWADQDVHNLPQSVREQALRMGANILMYTLTSAPLIN